MARQAIAVEEKNDARNFDELWTVHEVARHLRVDDTTVRRWIKTGVLEAVRLPHKGRRCGYRVRKDTLETLLKSTVA